MQLPNCDESVRCDNQPWLLVLIELIASGSDISTMNQLDHTLESVGSVEDVLEDV